MSIIIDPKWTFREAWQAAWEEYPSPRQFGGPNRDSVLERWANVVGRERAVYELDTTLNEYPSLKEALKALLMSESRLEKIRNNFNKMPTTTIFSSEPIVARLIDWITNIAKSEDVVTVLENLKFEDLQRLNAAVSLSSLKNVFSIWQANTENDNEEFWQKNLAHNSFIFAQLFTFPVILLEDKAYVGGKSIGNKGGNIVDFLYANNLTRNAALIEIKTPKTKLLGSKYRGDVYNISSELSGSIIQIANYKKSLMQNFINLTSPEEENFEAFNPKTIIIIGNIQDELGEQQKKKSFELFRTGLNDIQVITYDELFGKVEFLIALLEGDIIKK